MALTEGDRITNLETTVYGSPIATSAPPPPVGGIHQLALTAISADAAVNPHKSAAYVLTKGTALALTLAAPTSGTDDGVVLTFTSNTAAAHALTATGLLQTGSVNVNVATCAAQKGCSLTLSAYQGKWNVLSHLGMTFT